MQKSITLSQEQWMQGIALSTYDEPLRKVPVHLNDSPMDAFDPMERIGQKARDYAKAYFGEASFERLRSNLPLAAFAKLTFDELCKIRFSGIVMMDGTVEDEFKSNPRYTVVNKIANSMWRWGFGRAKWNEVVDSYDGIRSFSFDHPDFELRLDHTTSCNERGYSEHSRTYLDGVFAYLIYYKGKHVMTLGFSFMSNRRLLVQQVQLKNRRGNRFLFKLPKNRIEFVLDRFKAAFPRHKIFLVDGEAVARKSLNSYREGLRDAEVGVAKYLRRAQEGELSEWDERSLEQDRERVTIFGEKVEHLEADLERLRALYSDAGRHSLGKTLACHNLTHYEVKYAD